MKPLILYVSQLPVTSCLTGPYTHIPIHCHFLSNIPIYHLELFSFLIGPYTSSCHFLSHRPIYQLLVTSSLIGPYTCISFLSLPLS